MMKKTVILALLALLLAGCAGKEPPATEPAAETTVPAPTGLYDGGSELETRTNGAIRSYDLPGDGYYRISGIGERLMLMSGTEGTKLELYLGEACLPENEMQLSVDLREVVWQLTDTGVAYYDPQEQQVIYLDSQLQIYHSVTMPEDMEGAPIISPSCDEIYYCVGQEIRALDTERGISRLVKSQSCEALRLTGCYLDGRILSCQVTKENRQTTVYLSSEDGTTCSTAGSIVWLESYEDLYLGRRLDGVTHEYITGLMTGTTAQLNVPADTLGVMNATALSGAVGYGRDEENALVLSFYDLTTGQRTAWVSTGEAVTPIGLWADRWSGAVWLLCVREDSQVLLRWDVKASQVTEEGSYLGTLYTEAAPDEAGLAALQSRVDEINKQHGTQVLIWQSAVNAPGGYGLTPEYQVSAIEKVLDQLEPVLQKFPEKFLLKSVSTKIRICIVRSADGEDKPVQYWDEGDAYVILPVGADPREGFLQAFGYIVDSHVLGNSPMLDGWESLNPEGTAYGGQVSETQLKGDTQIFADSQSAASVAEERARLFYYAMAEENGEMFRAPVMQAKLLLLCQSIRDAWRLEKKTETYPWEQYLSESIAYVK